MMVQSLLKSPNRLAWALILTLAAAAWMASWFIAPTLWAIYIAVGVWPRYHSFLSRFSCPKLIAPAMPYLVSFGLLATIGGSVWFAAQTGLDEAKTWTDGETVATLQIKFRQSAMVHRLSSMPLVGDKIVNAINQFNPDSFTEQHNLANLISEGTFWGKEFFSLIAAAVYCAAALAFLLRNATSLLIDMKMFTALIVSSEFVDHLDHQKNLVRSIFNSIVVLGLLEAMLFGFAYSASGIGEPVLLALVTGAVSIIPMASSIIAGSACLYLSMTGSLSSALYLGGFAGLVLLVADPIVRPMLAGKNTEMPYWLTTIAMFAGLQTMGLLGLFLGPQLFFLLLHLVQSIALKQAKRPE